MACNPYFTVHNFHRSRSGLSLKSMFERSRQYADELGFNVQDAHILGYLLEQQCESLAEELDHIILKGSSSTMFRFEHGFDVISYDPARQVLCFWESKSGNQVRLDDLSAFKNAWGEPTRDQINKSYDGDVEAATRHAFENKREMFNDLLSGFPTNSIVRENIERCLSQGRFEYHLLGADTTTFSKDVLNKATQSPHHNY